jgi:hypothetical protein
LVPAGLPPALRSRAAGLARGRLVREEGADRRPPRHRPRRAQGALAAVRPGAGVTRPSSASEGRRPVASSPPASSCGGRTWPRLPRGSSAPRWPDRTHHRSIPPSSASPSCS